MRILVLMLASFLLFQNGQVMAKLHLCQDARGGDLCAQVCPTETPNQGDKDTDNIPGHVHGCCNAPLAITLQGPDLEKPELFLQNSAHQASLFLEVHFDIFHPPA